MPGLAEVEIQGCEPGCEHVWGEQLLRREEGGWHRWKAHDGRKHNTVITRLSGEEKPSQGQHCLRCHGWRGSLGLEETPERYIAHLVLVFRELRRVLRDDGTVFCNIGDSFGSGNSGQTVRPHSGGLHNIIDAPHQRTKANPGKRLLKGMAKQLLGIPWRLAFALQADGWWNRSEIIWAKGVSFCKTYAGSCMPESVRDRPTRSHEQVFLFTKSKKYYYDHISVKETGSGRIPGNKNLQKMDAGRNDGGKNGIYDAQQRPQSTRNLRSVWLHSDPAAEFRAYCASQGVDLDTLAQGFVDGQRELKSVWVINPKGSKLKHFASFPPKLVEPCIRAGSSERGCCPKCLSPWERVVEKTASDWAERKAKGATGGTLAHGHNTTHGEGTDHTLDQRTITTTGWAPTCNCNMAYPGTHLAPDDLAFVPYTPVPCTVLDPFVGKGTTLKVAIELGRKGIGIDLSGDYCQMAADELSQPRQLGLVQDVAFADEERDEEPGTPIQVRML